MFDIKKLKEDYKTHPRILELRLVLYYTMLSRAYGINKATEFYIALCQIMGIDWQKINGIINQLPKIRYLEKKDKKRYRQELVFMGFLYDETRYFIAKNIVNVSPASLYRKDAGLNVDDFLSEEWLERLDETVTICGIPQYALEAKRFIQSYQEFMEVLGNVSASKI